MNDTTLNIVSQHPHLGITLDHTSKHSVTEPMVRWDSLNAICTTLLCIFVSIAIKKLVLQMLHYCSFIWDPYHQNAINQLEMIQHRAAQYVTNNPWRRDILIVLLQSYTS